jgi:Spy/CpxP family protein refolding chaperone
MLNKVLIIIITIVLIAALTVFFMQKNSTTSSIPKPDNSSVYSPYAGQEDRGIKSLSQADIDGLLAGEGTPFGGMAKPAELSGYPGPRHVLDAFEAGEFELTAEQEEQIESLYEAMRSQAIELGQQIIEIEKEIDSAFTSRTIAQRFLQDKINESAKLYGQLRTVHLQAHLAMIDILTPEQVDGYNKLRGYAIGDPCKNIPSGHDPEMWKLHNNCQ